MATRTLASDDSTAIPEAIAASRRHWRLMLGKALDAASAGYRVGYDDATHFNREYKSLFGAPLLCNGCGQPSGKALVDKLVSSTLLI